MICTLNSGLVSGAAVGGIQPQQGWYSNWLYRGKVTIDNTAGTSTLNNHQVQVFVPYKAEMNADYSDIRFTDGDGITLIPYWLERSDATTAVFWVKVPSIHSGSIKTIYMYYGNAGASTLSNGNAVFEFFDDFSGIAVDNTKWMGDLAGFTVAGGYLAGSNTNFRIQSQTTHSNPVMIQTRTRGNTLAPNGQSTLGFYVSGGNSIGLLEHAPMKYWYRNDGSWNGPWDYNFAAWHNVKISVDAANNAQLLVVNDLDQVTSQTFTNTVSNERITLGTRYDNEPTCYNQVYDQQWDWVFARKYASPEPSATVGPDQQVNWYDSQWQYRRSVTIDNTANPLTLVGYQVKVIVPLLPGMNADFSDIRFTDGDEITLLPYWIESANSMAAVVWTKIPVIYPGSTKTIYLYYGNPSASSLSNGVATFEFFDDFSSIAGWTAYGPGASVSSPSPGIMQLNNPASLVRAWATPNTPCNVGNFVLEMIYSIQNPAGQEGGPLFRIPGSSAEWAICGYQPALRGRNADDMPVWRMDGMSSGAANMPYLTGAATGWDVTNAWYRGVVKANGNSMTWYPDTTSHPGTSITFTDGTYPSGNVGLWVYAVSDLQTDWMFVRKYTAVEPNAMVKADVVVEPNWYSGKWEYRKTVTIDNSANAYTMTEFQVMVTFDYEFGMNTDFSDIRFTDSDGKTEIPYWHEWNDGASAIFWVRVPSIWAGSVKTLYMYWGNPLANSISDGFATFEFFDDFDFADATKFTYGQNYGVYNPMNYDVSGGMLREWSDGSWRVLKMLRTFAPSETVAVGTRMMTTSTGPWHQNYFVQDSDPDRNRFGVMDWASNPPYYVIQSHVDNGAWMYSGSIGTTSFNTWFKSENAKRSSTTFEGRVFTDSRTQLGINTQDYPGWGDETWTWVNWQNWNVNTYYDWIYVRKVVPVDPSAEVAIGPPEMRWTIQFGEGPGIAEDKPIKQSDLGNLFAGNMIMGTAAIILIVFWRRDRNNRKPE
ncbi:MAG: DUF2341 domain-containing protein [Euryarchaeota archaeon]|nr:DUF2341 domain-containing protein [Euryarchaeota archaeon]